MKGCFEGKCENLVVVLWKSINATGWIMVNWPYLFPIALLDGDIKSSFVTSYQR